MNSNRGDIDRRDFIRQTSAAGLGVVATAHGLSPLLAFNGSPNEKVVIGVIGVNGRGVVHAQNFARLANSEVAYVCDVDANVVAKAVESREGSPALSLLDPVAYAIFRFCPMRPATRLPDRRESPGQ